MKPRLGVNIDHVATVRQARGEYYPQVTRAARACLEAGADQITIHLREDRRHIQDDDVFDIHKITKEFKRPLNLEMGCDPGIVDIAIEVAPEWICLVPEKREEVTTEGGLDLINDENFSRVKQTVDKLKSKIKNLNVSLFLEADLAVLEKAAQMDIDAVEIHTGTYAMKFLEGMDYYNDIEAFKKAQEYLVKNNIACHAGHGLTDKSTAPLVEMGLFEEYNIGHWIISQAIFTGLSPVVKELKNIINK